MEETFWAYLLTYLDKHLFQKEAIAFGISSSAIGALICVTDLLIYHSTGKSVLNHPYNRIHWLVLILTWMLGSIIVGYLAGIISIVDTNSITAMFAIACGWIYTFKKIISLFRKEEKDPHSNIQKVFDHGGIFAFTNMGNKMRKIKDKVIPKELQLTPDDVKEEEFDETEDDSETITLTLPELEELLRSFKTDIEE